MDRRLQLDELDSLKNIFYNEEFQVLECFDHTDKIQAIFWAFFTLPDNYEVQFLKSLDSPEPSCLKVKHLPPIELRLSLPEEYPSKVPPEFVISCQWLEKSKISALCKKLDQMWAMCEPMEILYCWCDFLKNESLAFLGYDKELDLTYLCKKHLSFIRKLQESTETKRLGERNGVRGNEEDKQRSEDTSASANSLKTDVSESVDSRNDSFDQSVTLEVDSVKEVKDNGNQRRHPYLRTNFKDKNKNLNRERNGSKFDERAVLNLTLKTSPIKVLENYNKERERVEFLKSSYTCNICFSDKLGKDCTQFVDCNHVFCISCIRSYFTVRIKDGTVQSIKCPEEKCASEALPSQVKEIVSEELFAKYDSVLLNTALDTLGDIVYCPRQMCQYPVVWDPEEEMASCPNCQYVFCVTCKMVYHGIEPCQFKVGETQLKLVEQYENASAEERQQMAVRYGKNRLESLVNNIKAEAWIKENSKACPRCSAAIEKSQGCNKMVCWKCNSPFCWLCCKVLNAKDPYAHFKDPKSHCVNKLFHLVPNSDDEDEDEDDWDWENFYFDPEDDFDFFH